MAGYLHTHATKALTVVLLLQAAAFYGFSRGEHVPASKPLANFSLSSSQWVPVREEPLDQDTLDVLKADDTLSRVYQNRQTGQSVQLFVAYFSTQRTGKTPHSPKNCLPGSGWVPTQSGTMQVAIPGNADPITINRYLVSREQSQDVVLYWYQSRNRVLASEYRAKLFTILDSIRYRRSDTSLVRVVNPVIDGNAKSATDAAVSFIRALFVPLKNYLPA
ncbi:MAG TPA: EpsI family protein [Bryobacteraceae bacterium]|nr:EpsI family protein [Bryobacteraceae bacterium]